MATQRPLIGIVPGYLGAEQALSLRDHYVDAIVEAGGTPLVLPITEDWAVFETLLPLCDGFLLTGGSDIDPARYGARPSSELLYGVAPKRETVEDLTLTYAYTFDIPTLGICRGMQMMNVFFGGTLYQDVAEEFCAPPLHPNDTFALGEQAQEQAGNVALEALPDDGGAIEHWQTQDYGVPTHLAYIVGGSRLSAMVGSPLVAVNSIHHQGVREVAPLLRAVAYASDGLVEGVEVRDRTFMMGVQWHPELAQEGVFMGAFFSTLIAEAQKTQGRRRAVVASLVLGNGCSESFLRVPTVPQALSILPERANEAPLSAQLVGAGGEERASMARLS